MNIKVGDWVFRTHPGKGPGPLARVLMIDGKCAFIKFKEDDPSAINTHDTALLSGLSIYRPTPEYGALAYNVVSVDGPEEAPAITVESVIPITPRDSRHDRITSLVSPEVARQASSMMGKIVQIALNEEGNRIIGLRLVGARTVSCAPYDTLAPDYGLNEVVR